VLQQRYRFDRLSHSMCASVSLAHWDARKVLDALRGCRRHPVVRFPTFCVTLMRAPHQQLRLRVFGATGTRLLLWRPE
jgi:hypothetical protein